ncbi:MAG: glutathione S-transferase family protein [Burkholderiaceae bacterium]
MLVVHHLNDSRSHRVLWLLEELGLHYEVRRYARNAETRLAPPELLAVHPLGKSPVLTDGDQTIIESGAIIDFIVRRHGDGRLQPDPATAQYDQYQQWLHYAEGSAMLPLMLRLYTSRLGSAAAPLEPRINSEIANHLGYINQSLGENPWLMGDTFSAADVQMSFIGEVGRAFETLGDLPALAAWVTRFQAREAYQKALQIGGPYQFAR